VSRKRKSRARKQGAASTLEPGRRQEPEMGSDPAASPKFARWLERPLLRVLVVLAGIVFGQAVLYGPSLTGSAILLPLDILAMPRYYLPPSPGSPSPAPHNPILSDLVVNTEPGRIFLHEEIAAGRFPLWNPHQYAGMPNSLAKFSPFVMLGACFESPKVLAWIELLAACIAGLGMYLFCRRVLLVSFWPAAFAAWCYPLTGFFVLWLGFGTGYPVVWLPWLLSAIHNALDPDGRLTDSGGAGGRLTSAGATGGAVTGVALTTALVLVSGRLDIAAQVLLVSGLFAAGCFVFLHHREWLGRRALASALLVLAGWGLGFMLAAPDTLHTIEYAQTGARAASPAAGKEERPPVGLPALPQVVLPFMYGSTQKGSFPDFPEGEGNLPESPSAAYSGILATLLLAPLAFCSRKRRALGVLLALLAFFCLSWSLDVPGLVSVLRLPVLNMMSHNRLTFGAAFSIVALAAVGLEVLWKGEARRGWWFWIPAAILAALSIWSIGHAAISGEPVVARLQAAVSQGQPVNGIGSLEQVLEIQGWFARRHLVSGALCGLGAAFWLLLWFRKSHPSWVAPLTGLLFAADLLWFGQGQPAQSPVSLYYPRIPVLEEIARSPAGRMICYNCLPAGLTGTHGLRDIRGYDSVDPARLVELIQLAADPRSPQLSYALTQWLIPRMKAYLPDIVELSPVLDMLNVQYVVFQGDPPKNVSPSMHGNGYWALVNRNALPRAFVPRRVEAVADDRARLDKLAAAEFDPRKVAYVESPVSLPAEIRGTARIVDETPVLITLSVRMETPGLVVLADLWDKGWKATIDGRPATIERTNHALRGVVVPAGESTVQLRYESASFILGLWLSVCAVVILASWLGYGALRRRVT
jgi:hypothetical protein